MDIREAEHIIDIALEVGFDIESSSWTPDPRVIAEAEDLLMDCKMHPEEELAKAFLAALSDGKPIANETIAQREKLPLPTFVHIEALPEMPPDLTACSDEEIRKLHSQFHAYQVRTNWLEGIQENKVKVAQHNFKQAYNVEMLKIDAFFREGNRAPKEKTKAYVEAEIMQNKSVLAKKEELLALESDLAELKTLADIYESNVSRLSRESSMRYAERG